MAQPTAQHDPARDDPKAEESRRDWEDVQRNTTDTTSRLKVPGGYLYRSRETSGSAVGLVFVPDSRA